MLLQSFCGAEPSLRMGTPLLSWLLLLLLVSHPVLTGELRVPLLASSCTQSHWGVWDPPACLVRACLVVCQGKSSTILCRALVQLLGAVWEQGTEQVQVAASRCGPCSENTGRGNFFGSWSCCIPVSLSVPVAATFSVSQPSWR